MSEDHDDFGGLERDLPMLMQRRNMLKLLAGGTLLALAACGSDTKLASSTAATTGNTTSNTPGATGTTGASATTAATATSEATATADTASTASCTPINEETGGPFPGDGTNGPNALTESGVVRSDIRSSFGSSTTVADGVPTTVTLTVVDTSNGCSAMQGAAVYIWHCNRDGEYSMYGQDVTNENYLRGVQETDADGKVTFTTIFPAAYSGRWPHMHFEVYSTSAEATSAGDPIKTSQLAMPADVCNLVFATMGYEQSVSNMSQTSLATDNVFSDDSAAHQIPTATGSVTDGYALALTVPV